MEELLTLKELLLQGNIPDAITLVEEMEEMSKDDKINNIINYGIILLIHLIKQTIEKRTTRSWDLSIRNSVLAIQEKNKRRKSGGFYLTYEELKIALEAAYKQAINKAALEVEEGRYSREELLKLVDKTTIINKAIDLISLVDD
ncbi:DUF29 family protein [Aphanothece sacrum]|uniref:DUF29 domain-containing protein n=1 Tax=Aphanothece sacrum FPU1 TaxID=1920663 RepID=A0A401IBN3_APHSA|nr:DUF29 family protein [Aphanothece sacrum]GBF78688.1 hypothetical protein AsFPU1_0077 [Aphanothece sacrum FPU1]GBF84977.1 hypothetical protein AsFPU3_2032 [Aphanothece sacrum FPU3]